MQTAAEICKHVYDMFFRYNVTAGAWEASGEAEARETREWDILDSTFEHWRICG